MMLKPIHPRRLQPIVAALCGLMLAMPACSPRSSDPASTVQVHRGETLFGLSFEERMAIPPRLSRLRGDAQKRADEIYDPFRSKDDAIRNEEYFAQLYDAAVKDVLSETKLTEEQLDQIIKEYQLSLGGNLR